LELIGAEVVRLRCYLDVELPVGIPNPETGEFYPELRAQVLESRADVGFGFDGDGDRLGVVDEKGQKYNADEILMLYAKDVLTKNKGQVLFLTLNVRKRLLITLKNLAARQKCFEPAGHSFRRNVRGRAMLGGEFSGHSYFKDDYFGFDDGIYAACRLLKILDENGKKTFLSHVGLSKDVFDARNTDTLRRKKKFEIVKDVVEKIKKLVAAKQFLEIDETDGARVKVSKTGWFLIRASNTAAYLSLRVEGKDKVEVEQILAKTAKLLNI